MVQGSRFEVRGFRVSRVDLEDHKDHKATKKTSNYSMVFFFVTFVFFFVIFYVERRRQAPSYSHSPGSSTRGFGVEAGRWPDVVFYAARAEARSPETVQSRAESRNDGTFFVPVALRPTLHEPYTSHA